LAFLAPEYIEDREESYGTDLWAFGCIIFYMLTGREPFDGTDNDDLTSEIVSGNLDWGLD
jgi:3-phosphoinositide dependent protein kinase-1